LGKKRQVEEKSTKKHSKKEHVLPESVGRTSYQRFHRPALDVPLRPHPWKKTPFKNETHP